MMVFFRTLWKNDAHLRNLAKSSFDVDISQSLKCMKEKIENYNENNYQCFNTNTLNQRLEEHGLVGVSARFKYMALFRLVSSWRCCGDGNLTVGSGFKRVTECVDSILDSIISVVGVGGCVKEFKDVITALRPIRRSA